MSATMAAAGRWQRDAELPFQRLDEETIVVNPRTREVHLLNETAGRIWDLLAVPRSVDELVTTLVDEYDADADELRTAIADCLSGLGDKKLVLVGAAARLP